MESEAYKAGREDYSDCKELTDNPYSPGTSDHDDWRSGFNYAERNDPLADRNMVD